MRRSRAQRYKVHRTGRSIWAKCAARGLHVDQGWRSRLGGHMTTVDTSSPASSPAQHLLGWDCIEFWVGNARTTAGFLMSAFGFHCTGYAGPETGRRDKASYVLEQGEI